MQTVNHKITPDSLIVTSETLRAKLAATNSTTEEDRISAVTAIEALVQIYVVPAMKDCPLSSSAFDTFDLDAVAGMELEGLVLSLFGQRLDELEKPSDEKLKEVLEEFDMPISDFAQRNRFYYCWAAERAASSIRVLINFLKEPLIGTSSTKTQSAAAERLRVKKILHHELPGSVEFALESLHERLERGM